jgi:predicted deacylase
VASRKPKAQKAEAPFVLARESVDPGNVLETEIPIGRLATGTWLSLPITVIHGRKPGPTLWMNAAIHGDELNGVAIIRDLVRRLEPGTLKGTVLAVPVVNVFGLVTQQRTLPDRRDLNRSFPGSKRGSLASQLAHVLMTEVVSRCDTGIDFHTGSGGRTNLAHLRCDVSDEETLNLARAFAPPLIMDSAVRDGSLRAAARDLGKRVLVFEGGEALRFSDDAIVVGIHGTLRVLKRLGMIPKGSSLHKSKIQISRQSGWVRARRGGFFRNRCRLGQKLEKGEIIGHIFEPTGKATPLNSTLDGIIIGQRNECLVHKGDAVVHLASVG